jgi:hypothetical protein
MDLNISEESPACKLKAEGLKMDAESSSETLVNVYQNTWSHIPEDRNLEVKS